MELHTIRRQDPAAGRDADERKRIGQYREAVEAAAAGKLGDSFEQLDKLGAVVPCGFAEQTDKLAEEYLQLAGEQRSAVVVNTTKLSANTTKQPECWDTDANAHALRISSPRKERACPVR